MGNRAGSARHPGHRVKDTAKLYGRRAEDFAAFRTDQLNRREAEAARAGLAVDPMPGAATAAVRSVGTAPPGRRQPGAAPPPGPGRARRCAHRRAGGSAAGAGEAELGSPDGSCPPWPTGRSGVFHELAEGAHRGHRVLAGSDAHVEHGHTRLLPRPETFLHI